MALHPETLIARPPDAIATTVDDDLVILNLATSHYVMLDGIGRHIWEMLAEPVQVAHLCRQLEDAFSAEPGVIAADVLAFLGELNREHLLHVVAG